jgi:hypothetical protein
MLENLDFNFIETKMHCSMSQCKQPFRLITIIKGFYKCRYFNKIWFSIQLAILSEYKVYFMLLLK